MRGKISKAFRWEIKMKLFGGNKAEFLAEMKNSQPSIQMGKLPKQVMWQANPIRQQYRKDKAAHRFIKGV